MRGIAIVSVLGFALLALVTLRPRNPKRRPVSEWLCLALLQLAAWLEHVATAWDAAIVRYRLERMALEIDMDSTRERQAREKWAA